MGLVGGGFQNHVARGFGFFRGLIGVYPEQEELQAAAARGRFRHDPEQGVAVIGAVGMQLHQHLAVADDGEIIGQLIGGQAEDIFQKRGQRAHVWRQEVHADARQGAAEILGGNGFEIHLGHGAPPTRRLP